MKFMATYLSELIPELFIFVGLGFLRLYLNKGGKSKGKGSYVLSERSVGCFSAQWSIYFLAL